MDSPDWATEATRLRDQRDTLLLRREVSALQEQEKVAQQYESALWESWGERVDPFEYLRDDPAFGIPTSPVSIIDDRKEGQYRPIFETEMELAAIRGQARLLAAVTSTSISVFENLTNYVFGTGFTYSAQAADGIELPTGLVENARRVIDRFLEDNDWVGDRERELDRRARRDGEAFVSLKPLQNGRTKLRFLEPPQITEPGNSREFDEWLGTDFASSWKFGVHTDWRDTENVHGYHVRYDDDAHEFDYFPAESLTLAMQLGSGLMEHIKRNVDGLIKRGLPDLYPVKADMEREAKLRRNTLEGAALQAAIAWVFETPPGTQQGGVSSIISSNATMDWNRTTERGTRTVYEQQIDPGTVLRPSPGAKYVSGPMGSERNPNFVLVAQYALRAIGNRWCMPEYMISGDASNANYASTLVAESPFVKAREQDQVFYKCRMRRIVWKVLKIAHMAGIFDKYAISFQQLRRSLQLVIDAPAVASRDPLKMAQRQQIDIQNRTLSLRTATAEAGREFDVERQNMEDDADPPPNVGGGIDQGMPDTDNQGAFPAAESGSVNEGNGRDLSEALVNVVVDGVIDRVWETYP